MAYPKSTSKKYKCDINRDSGWLVLGAGGFEPVRRVAINQDGSALRFRRVEHIKKMAGNPEARFFSESKRKAASSQSFAEVLIDCVAIRTDDIGEALFGKLHLPDYIDAEV